MFDDTVSPLHREDNRRSQGAVSLWSAVVFQAYADLSDAPAGTRLHDEAVAFCTGGGAWRESRVQVADCISVHADDIERGARRIIAARLTAPPQDPEKRGGNRLLGARIAAFVATL